MDLGCLLIKQIFQLPSDFGPDIAHTATSVTRQSCVSVSSGMRKGRIVLFPECVIGPVLPK